MSSIISHGSPQKKFNSNHTWKVHVFYQIILPGYHTMHTWRLKSVKTKYTSGLVISILNSAAVYLACFITKARVRLVWGCSMDIFRNLGAKWYVQIL